MRTDSRRISAIGAFCLLAVLVPAPAAWADGDDDDSVIALTGDVNVPENSTVDHVAVLSGNVTALGNVDGSVVIGRGDAVIGGRVKDDVYVFDGSTRLLPSAVVEGDLYTDEDPHIEEGARVEGEQKSSTQAWGGTGWSSFGRWFWWLAISLSALVLGLLFLWIAGRGRHDVGNALRERVGHVALFGILLVVGIPVLMLILLVTVIGLPLGLAILGALGLLALGAYAVGAYVLGHLFVRNAVLALLAGLVVLRLIALIPYVGWVFWLLTVIVGAGALWTARRAGLHRRPSDYGPPVSGDPRSGGATPVT